MKLFRVYAKSNSVNHGSGSMAWKAVELQPMHLRLKDEPAKVTVQTGNE